MKTDAKKQKTETINRVMGIKEWSLIVILSILWGQTHIESSLASILNATTPIFSVVLAHFLTKEERLTTNRISGVAIGWVGVAVLIGIELLRGFGVEVIGQIAVLGATLSYAFAAIYGRLLKRFKPKGNIGDYQNLKVLIEF